MMAAFSGYQTAIVLGRGFSSGQAGIFISLGCLAGIFSQPLLGAWADRHPDVPLKKLFGGCMLLALGFHAVFYFARPGFFGTALIFLALGALETNSYPLIDAMWDENKKIGALIDVIYKKAYELKPDGRREEVPIPADKMEVVENFYQQLCESVAETNEEKMEKFFNGEPFTEKELLEGLHAGVRDLILCPVM